jgi:hypothetical protein
VVGAQPRPCGSLFKEIEILPVMCQYILSLKNLILNNNNKPFQRNSSVHIINTRNKHRFHRPDAKLSCFQKNRFCAGIRIFNNLQCSLVSLKNKKA